MTKEEVADKRCDVSKATVNEIIGLYKFGCFTRWPRHSSNNIIDARWVITRKMSGGNVGIRCPLTIAFNDKFQDPDIYASATIWFGRPLANIVAIEGPGFVLFNFDVSGASAKGMIFE